jgi:Nif-specific regulatory protein
MSDKNNLSPFLSISEVTIAMNSTLDPNKVLDLILDHCIKFCSVESGSLMLINYKESVLDIVRTRGLSPSVAKNVKLKIGEGVTGLVAETGTSKLINDVSLDPNYISINSTIQSELAVPMTVNGSLIGVISLDSNRRNAFTQEHVDIVSILANQAAQIFKNLQSYRNLEQKNKIQQVLIEISKVVTSTLDLKQIFELVLSTIDKNLKLQKGSIILFDPETDKLKLVAAVGITEEEKDRGVYAPGEGITGKVYETGQPLLIESVAKDPAFLNRVGYLREIKAELELVSLLSVPITSELTCIGVISVFVVKKENLDLQTYLDFLLVVASILSQALKIQSLVNEATREISRENILLKRELKGKYKFGSLIGRSRGMEKLFEKIQLVADSRASVLITGESGTGKEMIASSIHYNSNRSEKPFIKINCAAIPENLLESELFGHKKGSFTGAVADKKGKFELADSGTIFLDEIGEMDINLQSKLLRVLQEREVEAVGAVKVKKVDIRVIAATNANLETLIQEKKFRSDLYYRLNVVNIYTPALRERKEDIPLLAMHFIDKYSRENEKHIKGISKEAIRVLLNYTWPGNVRELENVIERALVLSQNDVLDESDFSEIVEKNNQVAVVTKQANMDTDVEIDIFDPNLSEENIDSIDGKAMDVIVGEIEKRLIVFAMKRFKYTKTRVAKFLGINRNTLDKRIKELNIEY